MTQNRKDCTVIVSDIRDFTPINEMFQLKGDISFIRFVKLFYNIQLKLAKKISTGKVHPISVGDSIIMIFMGENHHIEGYVYGLTLLRALRRICNEFEIQHNVKINFGIGADCGSVTQIITNQSRMHLNTYIGSTINRASRIQDKTKDFGDTEMVISGNLYTAIIEKLFPESVNARVFESKNYDRKLIGDVEFIKISGELLLFYLFKLPVKGFEKAIPMFRVSNDLSSDDNYLHPLLKKLVPEQFENIYELIK